ncbi:hypothetical protein A3K78_10780 [Candidatus Bathyarchaeota archaeon RBG_13_52_12]|nr:MAG: hypothetical protein A3K78_10780 [Candidatus Bathyarchaeota archaeon RBG_13_52_12]
MNKKRAGAALFLLGCVLCVNSYIIIQGAQGPVIQEVYPTPGPGQFWVPGSYVIIQVPSYVFTQLILGISTITAGIIFIYEKPTSDV